MPDVSGRGRGDLLVTVQAITPRKLTREQRKLLEQLAATLPRAGVRADAARGRRPRPLRQGQRHLWLMRRSWPALLITQRRRRWPRPTTTWSRARSTTSRRSPSQDLTELPLPPGGLWDPTYPPPPDPPPAPLHWRVFFRTRRRSRRGRSRALRERIPICTYRAEDVPDEDWAARSQRALTAVARRRLRRRAAVGHAGSRQATRTVDRHRAVTRIRHRTSRLDAALSARAVGDRRARARACSTSAPAPACWRWPRRSGARARCSPSTSIRTPSTPRGRAPRSIRRRRSVDWLVGDFRDRGWDALGGGPLGCRAREPDRRHADLVRRAHPRA